jgi:GNAT superfamily N-acetyltransferase
MRARTSWVLWTPSSRYAAFSATIDDAVVGVLLGGFDSDFNDNYAFFGFDLPPEPHAFLSQLHVLRTARRSAVGRALIDTYVTEARHRGCTFVGGSLDLSDAPRGVVDSSAPAVSPRTGTTTSVRP